MLSYASETWPLSRLDERLLCIFERRILSYIFGPVEENGIWRKRYNHELYELFNKPDIIEFIKVKRLEWVGHIIRAGENRTIKRIFNTKPERKRKARRPRLRWEECVWQDIRILGSVEWRRMANTSVEGQGPQRAVVSVMMMIRLNIFKNEVLD
jgi:hypothetical protein